MPNSDSGSPLLAKLYCGVVVTIAAIATYYIDTPSDEELELRYHCEMVSLWDQAKANNIPAENRPGWPNYNDTDCGDNK